MRRLKKVKVILADIINPISDRECQYIKDGLMAVDSNGKIIELGARSKLFLKYQNNDLLDFSGQIMMPTFFDMHFHWVQDQVRLMPKKSLLTWLKKYTWPVEAKFSNYRYVLSEVKKFKKELVRAGTLGGAVYASIHPHTASLALEHFVGDFIVGNVLMDINSPEYLSETTLQAKEKINSLSKKFKRKYVLTPRFALTTSQALMQAVGILAKRKKLFIQTHLAENKEEIKTILQLFPTATSYTEIYHRCKILGPTTLLAHAIYLSSAELKLLQKTNTAIIHCPTSNAPVKELGLGSGLFDFKKIEKYKLRWALGSDIGGGPYLSMFDVIRSFVLQNKKNKEATFTKGLYHATLAGAEILQLAQTDGNFAPGKWANFILVGTAFLCGVQSIPQRKAVPSAETILKKIILSKKNNRHEYINLVRSTYYRGKRVSIS